MNKAAWASYWLVALIWGSSFLLISIGVEAISATQLVFMRTTIAAIGLTALLYSRGMKLPSDWPTIRALLINGIGNATIPYTLISLSEQEIPSGLAATLQATASLFTLVVAHFAFADERINNKKVVGLAFGFFGVVVLSSGAFEGGELNIKFLLGQMGMVVASLFYAFFTVHSRRMIQKDIAPMVVSATTFIGAAIFAGVFMGLEPMLGGRAATPLHLIPTNSLLAVLGLGFVNTFIAYGFFYFVVQQLGAFRASMVTYVVPVVGLFLGAVVGEDIRPYMLGGAALIFLGIGIINLNIRTMGQFVMARVRP